jgi:hypothetical protein
MTEDQSFMDYWNAVSEQPRPVSVSSSARCIAEQRESIVIHGGLRED